MTSAGDVETTGGPRGAGDPSDRPVGLTRDIGWNAGARRTVHERPDVVWHVLLSDALPLWFGTLDEPLELLRGAPYRTREARSGEIRSAEPGRRLRFTRSVGSTDETTTVQLTVTPAATGATVAFHEERLAGPEERAESIREWKAALERIEAAFDGPRSVTDEGEDT
jgi:uncharacterized protein YndB with AHSA1/START domain